MARGNGKNGRKNRLFYGDNLDILRRDIRSASVDLVYLDPPFNSNRSYNVLFGRRHGTAAKAQIEAFDDTWTWTPETESIYLDQIQTMPPRVSDAVQAMYRLLGENDVMAYLVMMTPRLVELHRVLKPTGSLYLHCDPTISHYLKVVLDAIFDARNFRNEITWQRTNVHSDAKRWSPVADVLLYYGKTDVVTWNPVRLPHSEEYVESKYRNVDPDGRRFMLDNMTSPNPRPNMMYEWKGHASPPYGWRYSKETMARLDAEGRIWYPESKTKRPRLKRYLDEMGGVLLGNVWTDIDPINSQAKERLGYPTQKPLALMERIIKASSDEGDLVLDPFCGCGTTVHAAQALNRRWIGIDVTYLAVDLIRRRLENAFGSDASFEIDGIPADLSGAEALFARSPLDFERWAVSEVYGQPNERQVGDKGIDGVIRFMIDRKNVGRVLVSVKGGKTVPPTFARDLLGTVKTQKAEMGILITMGEPTRGVTDAVNHAGTYENEAWGRRVYPKIQVITVKELLDGKRPNMPPPISPYIEASRQAPAGFEQATLDQYDEPPEKAAPKTAPKKAAPVEYEIPPKRGTFAAEE